jgi:hypothetical protein
MSTGALVGGVMPAVVSGVIAGTTGMTGADAVGRDISTLAATSAAGSVTAAADDFGAASARGRIRKVPTMNNALTASNVLMRRSTNRVSRALAPA